MSKYIVLALFVLAGCAHNSNLNEEVKDSPKEPVVDAPTAMQKSRFVPYRNSNDEVVGFKLLENRSAKGISDAGVQVMDVILAVDGLKLQSEVDAAEAAQAIESGNYRHIQILRGANTLTLTKP